MELSVKNNICNNKQILTAWLSQCILCQSKPKEFNNRITFGKIVYCLYEQLGQPAETFSHWLDRMLINNMKKVNCKTVDPFILYNRVSLQTNTIIRIFELSGSDLNNSSNCSSEEHLTKCCYIIPNFISSIINLSSSEEDKKLLTFIIDPSHSHAVRLVDLPQFEKIFKFYQSDSKNILTEKELVSYLTDKYDLTTEHRV